MIRRLKLAYLIYNIFNKSRLTHNVRLYKKLGLDKHYFSSISSKDFVGIDPSKLSENIDVKKITENDLFKKLPQEDQQSLLDFDKQGYSILREYVNKQEIEEINNEIDRLLSEKKLKFTYGNKIMFAFKKIAAIRKIVSDENFNELLSSILSDKAKLFQSINFLKGSEQEAHSDSIHMTTFPLGGLLGVWVALEDIEMDNGPLLYYPGSHQLPYYLNKDYENEGDFFMIGDKDYSEYENMIGNKLTEFSLEKKVFTAKAGDVLIWHANLVHGGEKHLNVNKTRKSVVFHFYAENRICYHEITQRPTLFE